MLSVSGLNSRVSLGGGGGGGGKLLLQLFLQLGKADVEFADDLFFEGNALSCSVFTLCYIMSSRGSHSMRDSDART
jgi:hypothetical protein